MRRKAFLLIFLFSTYSILKAQEFQGVATYFSASTLDVTIDSTKVSPEQQKMMMDMLRKQMQKEYELVFSREESLYKEVESLGRDGGGFKIMAMISGSGGSIYKNLAEARSSSERDLFGKLFLVKDSLKEFDWQISGESRKIGSYNCIKAVARKVVEKKTYPSKEIVNDTIELVAWFTPQIPVSNGPSEYGGLPGLILEVQDGNTRILCKQVVINPEKRKEIVEPSKGEVVTEEEFKVIMEDKLTEMQEMYGGDYGSGRFQISR